MIDFQVSTPAPPPPRKIKLIYSAAPLWHYILMQIIFPVYLPITKDLLIYSIFGYWDCTFCILDACQL